MSLHELSDGPRVVLLCAASPDADPDPVQTGERAVRLLGVGARTSLDEVAAALAARNLGPVGVVGWGDGAELAATLAARRPELVSRLVIGAAPEPAASPGAISAKTLLLYAQSDPAAGPRQGRAWLKTIPGARLETIPRATHLPIGPMWKRVLSFLAPGKP